MAEMTEDEKRVVKKWKIILDKCGNLTTNEQVIFLANTLEALRQKSIDSSGNDRTLALGDTLNVADPTNTNRLVISYDPGGAFVITRQHKDWVDD